MAHRDEFIQLLVKVENMCHEQLESIKREKPWIALIPRNIRPVHSAGYRAGRTARQCITKELQNVFQENVIGPSSTEWPIPIAFVPK